MSGSYLITGTGGPVFVTDHVTGKVSLVPGLPIISTTPPQAAVLPNVVSDADTLHAPVIGAVAASFLLPSLFADADAIFTPALGTSASVLPSLINDADALNGGSIVAEIPGHGTQHVRPTGRVSDAEVIYAAAIGASVKPALVPNDDVVPSASTGRVLKTALVAADDGFFAFNNTRFTAPSVVSDADAIGRADVGRQVIATMTTDVDAIYGVDVQAYNDVLPETWFDEENVENYPFFIQGIEGGIPAPKREGLTGTIRPQRRVLTGSISRQIRLTGSLKRRNARVQTGSVRGVHYGTGKKR